MMQSAPAPLLTLRHIAKTYPGARALRGVEFDLRSGEVHAVLGENGAGKSTLIKIISGLVAADPGAEILVAGEKVLDPSPARMQALGLSVVYQNPTLFGELSVAENLLLGEEGFFISWHRRREVARERLGRVGASLTLAQPANTLRMAEKQLLEIARALGRHARILILDEPTASLAQQDADRLLALVEKLRAEGVGIIYISHRLEEVLRIADRATVLRDGAGVGTFDCRELDRAQLIRLMAGRELAEQFPKQQVPVGDILLATRHLSCAPLSLHDVTLDVRRGEILGLAGLVGAGRTELARVLFGLNPATSGEIFIDGQPVVLGSPAEAMSHGLAYVPEDRKEHGVIEDLSVTENISLAVLRQVHPRWLDEPAERALALDFALRLGLKAPSLHAPTRTLSGGNQQKVALARWLATRPRLLILDEPTQGIDVAAKAELHRLMGELVRQGLTLILISSELPELIGLADRIAVLRRGRLSGIVNAGDATRESILRLAMEDAT